MPPTTAEFAISIEQCWSIATASVYTLANPAKGQCSVTALLAQDCLGGDILKTRVTGVWHFYNFVNGERLDFTASQFDDPIIYEDIASGRADAFMDTTSAQYRALSAAFREQDNERE